MRRLRRGADVTLHLSQLWQGKTCLAVEKTIRTSPSKGGIAWMEYGKCVSFNVMSSDSLSLNFRTGELYHNYLDVKYKCEWTDCCADVNEGDYVRMEVVMDANPQTVQFFVNGERGECFVFGLPESVRIGFSVCPGSSFRIDRITQQQRPTEIDEDLEEIKWAIETTPWPYY
ncbi:hypothetical protein BLNAU_9089 [Blattamonas nauphoetae]|uniref:Uncharacterized protein n=1 Tax=Blattamonas nauphoetae TaxID=2049346 RepID=A0ABQ9XWS6_9EUKA|nr:hypothetical protein BLNAU_9089 [Blattamonas nauphoetae]